ncbi:MAG: hypothetical protein QXY49_05595 [Thermofilaceae archaeon]
MSRARRKRVEDLAALIIQIASRDVFGSVGRVLIPELEIEGYSYDEISEALSVLREEGYRITVVGDIVKIDFSASKG